MHADGEATVFIAFQNPSFDELDTQAMNRGQRYPCATTQVAHRQPRRVRRERVEKAKCPPNDAAVRSTGFMVPHRRIRDAAECR